MAPTTWRSALWVCCFPAILPLLLVARPVSAQTSIPDQDQNDTVEPAAAAKTGKVLRALRVSTPPVIDGRLEDEVWLRAESIEDFVQWEPDNMAALSQRTVIQVAYDERNLYIAALCYEADPGLITAGLGRRDNQPPSDFVAIGFDPRHDHQTAYVFQANPSGVQSDFAFFDDTNIDRDYDGVWNVTTGIRADGWVAEFQVPFSQMRFDVATGTEVMWGFTVRREIQRTGESGEWIGRPRGERGDVSRWGHLVFGDGLSGRRRFEVTPSVLARAVRAPGEVSQAADAGLDLRMGLGSSATFSATMNPDFAQVELDPSVVNLTVFETFFPEKRPFFLEDSRTFVPPYGIFQLFHSRRIGRSPGRLPLQDGDDLIDRPDETTILGAAKVTGKSSGWTYGTLTALTGREYATVNTFLAGHDGQPDLAQPRVERRVIEPYTSYNVARLQRDILGGSSNVGAIVTGVVRERADDAFTGGADYNLRWDENRVGWNGHWAVTRAPGAGGVKTSGGGVTNFNVSRKHWSTWSHFDHFGRDFRINDIGFFRSRTNRNQLDGGVSIEQPDPWKAFRNVGSNVYGGKGWNNDRLIFSEYVGGNYWMTFRNFWNVNGGWSKNFEVLDDIDTRGGPPIVSPASLFAYMNLNSDSRRSWRLNVHLDGHTDEKGGSARAISTEVTIQPSGRLQISMASRYDAGTAIAQWITNRDVTADGMTDNVYGTLRSDVVDITLRGTYAIHRDLTLQAFLQPFVAVADYSNVRRLARPRSFDFEPATLPDNPDFSRRSVRGNIVLRWEYIRGSTLFVVWNLSTLDETRAGRFTPLRDLGDAFDADGTHVLMVKASYWLSR